MTTPNSPTDVTPKAELQLAPYFKLTSTGLEITGDPTYDEWEAVGETLKFLESSIQFALGDWLRYGEQRKWGEKYTQAARLTGYSENSLAQYKWVAGAVNSSIRIEELPFAHHHLVAPLRKEDGSPDTDKQRHYLELAERDHLTVAKLRKVIERDQLTEGSHPAQNTPQGIYNVIYADPPWQYDNTGVHGAADDHYPTMPLDDICAFLDSIKLRIDNNAVLFMWVTNPFLQDAFQVLDAWGFEYKTNVAWVKTDLVKPGSGFYVRGRHELLFICTRGSFTPLDKHISPPIGSVIEAPLQEHSRKPDAFYELIERLYPGCNYIELFNRRVREGWDGYGNEIG